MLARFATLGSDGEEDFVTIDTERERMELFEAPTGFVHAQYKARISWLEAALSLTRGKAPTSSWANSDIIACEPLNWAGIAASSLRSYTGLSPRFNLSLLDQFRTIGDGIAVTPLSAGTNALIVTFDSAPNFVGLLFGDDPAASGSSDPSPVARMLSIMNLEFVL